MKKGQNKKYGKPIFNNGVGLYIDFMGLIQLSKNQQKAIQIGKQKKTKKLKD